MATKVYMEALSPTMEEGRVISWLKSEGDSVSQGDILAEIETDKAIMELQARGDGVLRRVLAAEGATVDVGTVIGVIAAADDDIDALLATDTDKADPTSDAPKAPADSKSPSVSSKPHDQPAPGGKEIKSSPLARRMAQERSIDLAAVTGTGPGGRIIKRDIDTAPSPGAAPTAATGTQLGGFEDVPLSQIRKTIASRLAQSLGPVPHFFLTSEIDMERVWEARKALLANKDAPKISFNDIIIKVVAEALRQHRACNAWWQEDHIRYFNEVHIAMAVAVEDGLITPVIRNTHLKSLREIAIESRDLALRARDRKLRPEEYIGATFTVSNLGMLGIDEFTAVINPPEAGILAVGSITQRPVVTDDGIVARRRMRVTMSCDHRVIDGATGARFLQTVKLMLENPLAIVW